MLTEAAMSKIANARMRSPATGEDDLGYLMAMVERLRSPSVETGRAACAVFGVEELLDDVVRELMVRSNAELNTDLALARLAHDRSTASTLEKQVAIEDDNALIRQKRREINARTLDMMLDVKHGLAAGRSDPAMIAALQALSADMATLGRRGIALSIELDQILQLIQAPTDEASP